MSRRTGIAALTLLLAVLGMVAWGAQRPAEVEAEGPGQRVYGIIASDTTWALADSPFIVIGDVTVAAGVTLTIEPGVVVEFSASLVPWESASYGIVVSGTLRAQGTSSDPISLDGHWWHLDFTEESVPWDEGTGTGSVLEHCQIDGENRGGYPIPGRAAINIDNASPRISDCTMLWYLNPAISVTGDDAAPLITDNDIHASEGSALNLRGRAYAAGNRVRKGTVLVAGNATLTDNTVVDVEASGQATVTRNLIGGNLLIGERCDAPVVTHNLIQGYVRTRGNVTLTHNTIAGADTGIFVDAYAPGACPSGELVIEGNNILDHAYFALRLVNTSAHIMAENNWWGFETTAEMEAKGCDGNIEAIWDGWDEPVLGTVEYCRWAVLKFANDAPTPVPPTDTPAPPTNTPPPRPTNTLRPEDTTVTWTPTPAVTRTGIGPTLTPTLSKTGPPPTNTPVPPTNTPLWRRIPLPLILRAGVPSPAQTATPITAVPTNTAAPPTNTPWPPTPALRVQP